MHYLIFFLSIIISRLFGQAPPNFNWVVDHATFAGKEPSYSIVLDSINKVIYSCGYIENARAFTGLFSTEMNYGDGNGKKDGYLSKHNFNGTLLWVVNIGTDDDDEARGVSLKIDGNVYTNWNLCPKYVKF